MVSTRRAQRSGDDDDGIVKKGNAFGHRPNTARAFENAQSCDFD